MTDPGEHWDLMIEHGDVLLTWQLPALPDRSAWAPLPARRIADHRKVYLEYEGPLTGDRGRVRRADGGRAEMQKLTEIECLVTLQGRLLSGDFVLTRPTGGADWVLDRALAC